MRVPPSRWAIAAVLVALVASAPAAAAPHGHGQGKTPSGARLAACHRSPRAEARVAVVSAWMRPIPTASRLALKIDLYERPLGGGPWALRADVPGLGSWTSPSDPGIGDHATDLFKYRQAVARLDVPFAYRFRVAFRWLDDGGKVVRKAAVTTRACREPDLRPDLTIVGVRSRALGDSGRVRYRVTVGNEGSSAARGVVVGATLPGDAASRTRRIGRVDRGGLARVVFLGPGCAAGQVGPSFTVDPASAIDESDEGNNALVLACPVP